MYLGIDAGGTHTDAVLVKDGRVMAWEKVPTRQEDLPASIADVLEKLAEHTDLGGVKQVTVGSTLAVNAVVRNKIDPVGLILTAGPGLAPEKSALGEYVYVAGGGLDHRGKEVTRLDTQGAVAAARRWMKEGVRACAIVGKFSPRNAEHERKLGEAVSLALPELRITEGHRLSGNLNFPRRIATAYFNAAVSRLHDSFIDALEQALEQAGIRAPVRLLKADGGSLPLPLSRREPVRSILSGPAASAMGLLALCPDAAEQDVILLDIGGTTTDIALYAGGSPVLSRSGMRLNGRSTLVRALATSSIGVGGDSLLHVEAGKIQVGPHREGRAVAFGGGRPTLLDALNVLGLAAAGSSGGIVSSGGNVGAGIKGVSVVTECGESAPAVSATAGDALLSLAAVEHFASVCGKSAPDCAREALTAALEKIAAAVNELVADVNAAPVYTLAALVEKERVAPKSVRLVGGPAELLREAVSVRLGLPVHVPPYAAVANAVGAALTLPTDSLTLFADTGAQQLRVPSCDIVRPVPAGYTLSHAEQDAKEILLERLAAEGLSGLPVEIVSADSFAILDESGHGSKDLRVEAQLVPGIVCTVAAPGASGGKGSVGCAFSGKGLRPGPSATRGSAP